MNLVRPLLATLLFATCAPGARSADQANLAQIFEGRYVDLRQAMHSHDRATIKAMLASDFVSIDMQGKVTDADTMIGEVLALPDDPNRKPLTTVLSVRIDGSDALIKQHYAMATTRKGPDGTAHVIELESDSDDIWANSNSTWLLKRTATRAMIIKRDGVVVVHNSK